MVQKRKPISYVICMKDRDYQTAYKFLKGTEFEDVALSYPTIMAVQEGTVLGMLGTHPNKKMIIAGPLYIKGNMLLKAMLEVKLVDAYESLLINLGVKAYVFYVKKNDRRRINMLREIDLRPQWETEGSVWYIRRF